MRRACQRHRIRGFGPVGLALLPLLASLIWAAAGGFDLRYQVQWLICEAFGWRTLYKFTIALHGHNDALWSPAFSTTALCVVLLALHFAPRRPRARAYGLLVAWALAAPAALYLMPAGWKIPPAWFPVYKTVPWFDSWAELLKVLVGLTTAVPLWFATRSRFVVGATLASVLVLFPFSNTAVLMNRMGTVAYGVYLWHGALAAILGWWVYTQRRDARPEHACQSCGYDLRDLPSAAACPECGAPRAAAPPPAMT